MSYSTIFKASGKPSTVKSHSIGNRKYTNRVKTTIEIRFIIKPLLTISGIRKYPDPKTTAFGGVATGNINAQDAAPAAATIKIKGWISTITAIGARTGNSIAVVAVLEVISVKKLTAAMSKRMRIIVVMPAKEVI